MPYCNKCGKKVETDTEFCSSCGHKLTIAKHKEPSVSKHDKIVSTGEPKESENMKIEAEVPTKHSTSKSHQWLFYVVIAVVFVGAVSAIMNSLTPVTPTAVNTDKNVDAPKQLTQTKQSCPFECCVNEASYENRICQGNNYQCISNKCRKADCPYECCIEGEFSAKTCQTDYECQNSRCVAIDSDGDGLTDIEEKQIGTNPKLPDSDGDTLSDYQEVRALHTNPMNANTDGDRYNDNIDPSPTTINTANIVLSKSNERGDYNLFNIAKDGVIILGVGAACTASFGACAVAIPAVATVLNPILNDVIYTSSADIAIYNTGNDYTSFVNYDAVYRIGATPVLTVSKNVGKLNAGESQTIPLSYEIKIKDLPNSVWNLISGKSKISIDVKNAKFEKFGN